MCLVPFRWLCKLALPFERRDQALDQQGQKVVATLELLPGFGDPLPARRTPWSWWSQRPIWSIQVCSDLREERTSQIQREVSEYDNLNGESDICLPGNIPFCLFFSFIFPNFFSHPTHDSSSASCGSCSSSLFLLHQVVAPWSRTANTGACFFLEGGFLMYITGGTRLKMDSYRSLSSLKHLKVRPSQAGGNSKLVACCSHETALFVVFVFLQVSHGHSKAACLNLPVECGNPFLRCWSRCARNRATISWQSIVWPGECPHPRRVGILSLEFLFQKLSSHEAISCWMFAEQDYNKWQEIQYIVFQLSKI